MKNKTYFLFFIVSFFFSSCSKDDLDSSEKQLKNDDNKKSFLQVSAKNNDKSSLKFLDDNNFNNYRVGLLITNTSFKEFTKEYGQVYSNLKNYKFPNDISDAQNYLLSLLYYKSLFEQINNELIKYMNSPLYKQYTVIIAEKRKTQALKTHLIDLLRVCRWMISYMKDDMKIVCPPTIASDFSNIKMSNRSEIMTASNIVSNKFDILLNTQ